MKVRLKNTKTGKVLAISPESESEKRNLIKWGSNIDGLFGQIRIQSGKNLIIRDFVDKNELIKKPINISYVSENPEVRLLSNLAKTPFELDGENYASVEAFWQGLKFPDQNKRKEISNLFGFDAKLIGNEAPKRLTFIYNGKRIRKGTYDHWQLMRISCEAKFQQNEEAKKVLMSTKGFPLIHRTRSDSKNIPGVIFAEILMRIRDRENK